MSLKIRTSPEIALLVRDVPAITSSTTVDWGLIHSSNADVMPMVKDRVSRQIAWDFASQVFERGLWTRYENALGVTLRVDAYVLTFDRLVDLLQQAYDKGRLDRPPLTPPSL